MFVHGNNLEQKENHKTKYRDAESRLYLSEIRIEYNQWKIKNETLKGPLPTFSANDSELIEKWVHLLNEYKDFLDLQHYAENLTRALISILLFWKNSCIIYSKILWWVFPKML